MDLSDKRLKLYGLIRGCPMGEPIEDCPVNHYREMHPEMQFEIAESISAELLGSILFYHDVCLAQRENF